MCTGTRVHFFVYTLILSVPVAPGTCRELCEPFDAHPDKIICFLHALLSLSIFPDEAFGPPPKFAMVF